MFLATLYLQGVSKVIAYNDLAGKCMKQAGKDIKEWWWLVKEDIYAHLQDSYFSVPTEY